MTRPATSECFDLLTAPQVVFHKSGQKANLYISFLEPFSLPAFAGVDIIYAFKIPKPISFNHTNDGITPHQMI